MVEENLWICIFYILSLSANGFCVLFLILLYSDFVIMSKFFDCAIQKSYDALTSVSMLKSRWIAKASSQQRKGR